MYEQPLSIHSQGYLRKLWKKNLIICIRNIIIVRRRYNETVFKIHKEKYWILQLKIRKGVKTYITYAISCWSPYVEQLTLKTTANVFFILWYSFCMSYYLLIDTLKINCVSKVQVLLDCLEEKKVLKKSVQLMIKIPVSKIWSEYTMFQSKEHQWTKFLMKLILVTCKSLFFFFFS